MRLLIVTPTPPDRPDRDGMTQIAYQLIRRLGERDRIEVWTLSDPREEMSHISGARNVRTFPRLQSQLFNHYLSAKSLPFFQARNESAGLHQALRELPPNSYDLVILHSPFVTQYLNDLRIPAVIHCIDSLSLWFERAARHESNILKRWHLSSEGQKAASIERRLYPRANLVTVVSQDDAEQLRRHSPQSWIETIPIGIDESEFYPPQGTPRDPATLVMTGIMDYPPNVEAAEFFVRRVWPGIRVQHPEAQFRIVGRDPAPRVIELQSAEGVTVTGKVPSVAAELRQATLAVSPLLFGTGYKIKVNEALACGTPIVVSPASLPGTNLTPGRDCLVAEKPPDWIQFVCRLLDHPEERQALSQQGLKFVQTRLWPKVTETYRALYQDAIQTKTH